MVYDWGTQLQVGAEGEHVLDGLLSLMGSLTPATMEQQRQGIDRIMVDPHGRTLTLEYKTDTKAHKTGNAYIETLSVSTTGKRGWLYTCTADKMVYYTPGDGKVRIIPMHRMRKAAADWQWLYPYAKAQNRTYYGEGILVPLAELDTISSTAFQLELTNPCMT